MLAKNSLQPPSTSRWGSVTNKQDLHSYTALEQPVVEPLWDTLTDETEIAWLIAEKLADKADAECASCHHADVFECYTCHD